MANNKKRRESTIRLQGFVCLEGKYYAIMSDMYDTWLEATTREQIGDRMGLLVPAFLLDALTIDYCLLPAD